MPAREQGVPDVVIANAGVSIGMDTAIRTDRCHGANFCHQQCRNGGNVSCVHQTHGDAGSAAWWGIASVAGIGIPGHGAYCASKAGYQLLREPAR